MVFDSLYALRYRSGGNSMLEQQGFESGGLCSAKSNVPSWGAGGYGKDEALAQRHGSVQEIRVRAMGAKVSLRGQESQIEFRG